MNKCIHLALLSFSSLLYIACGSSAPKHSTLSAQAPVVKATRSVKAENPNAIDKGDLERPERFVRIHTPMFAEKSESLVITSATWVLATPFAEGERLGLISGSTRVAEKSHVSNEHCPTPWVEVEPQGWVCVAVKPSMRPPTSANPAKGMRKLPGSFAIAPKGTVFYKSIARAEAGERGRPAKGDMVKRRQTLHLDDGRKFWKTDRGEYVDASTLRRMSGSRFQGVDLSDEHSPMLPFAFAVHTKSPKKPVVVRNGPSYTSRVVRRMSGRSVVEVLEHSDDGEFVRIDEGKWIARTDLRIVEQRERPSDVKEDGRWIDVDLDQQLVVAYEGARPVFATLASTGKGVNATPTGVFNITRKKRQTTMRNDRKKRQTYSVAVPWPVYFNKGFAFHSTYWHNNFGSPRSHGCINLSPTDAVRLYRFVGPEMPAGWTVVYGHESQPGTAVQVRSAEASASEDSDSRLASQ
jgi:lipoprotein-anchoring transpeptidase ErfK/SrfK